MNSIPLNDDTLNSLIAKTIVDSLTPDARERMIQNAIQALLAPDKYNPKSNAIQDAFNHAVRTVAAKYASEMLTQDSAFNAQIKAIFADVAARMLTPENREKLITDMADRITRALTGERY